MSRTYENLFFPVIKEQSGYKKTELTDSLAILSKMVYWMRPYHFDSKRKPNPFENYMLKNAPYIDLFPHIRDYSLVDYDGYYGVAVNETKKLIVFIFRGTRFYNLFDLGNCITLVYLKKPYLKVAAAQKYFNKWMQYFEECGKNSYKIVLTGHSIGGTVAEYLTADSVISDKIDHCETFNVGTSPIYVLIDQFRNLTLCNKIISHHVSYDYFSLGYCRGAIKDYVQPNDILPHKMMHFIENIENKEDEINEQEQSQYNKQFKLRRINYRVVN